MMEYDTPWLHVVHESEKVSDSGHGIGRVKPIKIRKKKGLLEQIYVVKVVINTLNRIITGLQEC